MCLCLETTFTETNFLDKKKLLVFLGFQVIADGKYGLFSSQFMYLCLFPPVTMQLFFNVYIVKETAKAVGRW